MMAAPSALGIGAASFGSGSGDLGTGFGDGIWGRDSLGREEASKDIAESPTASPERPRLINN